MVTAVAGVVGWIGVVGTVSAYALVSQRRMDANSIRFQAINVAGAALLALSALSRDNWPSFASNFLWLAIGAHTLHVNRHAINRAVADRFRRLAHERTTRARAEGPRLETCASR
jgi:hypothetical protein